jgi:hypothetical protein
MKQQRRKEMPVIGWREWVALPELGIQLIKAKIDTGARSSSLHAFEVRTYQRDGETIVRFKVHPTQRNTKEVILAESLVVDMRSIRSSSGKATVRPVIVTRVELMGQSWPIEVTLANRDEMGFRMLLGREAYRGRMLVDAGKSYCGGHPGRAKPNKNRS